MGLTIIGGGAGGGSGNQPIPFAPPIIKQKINWSDDWQINTDLILVSCGVHAGSTAISSAQVYRRYGHVKYPFENNYPANDRIAWDLNGNWVQVNIVGANGTVLAHQGIAQTQASELMGSATEAIGIQNWIVDGGLRILEKQIISGAYFDDGQGGKTLAHWVPPLNLRDRRGLLVGNSNSTAAVGALLGGAGAGAAATLYGGIGVWTHLQYLQYLVTNFIQQPNGPTWTIGGQSSALASLTTSVVFGHAESAAAMIRKLVPVEYGFDFSVTPTAAGFEITIFSLNAQAINVNYSGGSVTLPANTNQLKVSKTSDPNFVEANLVESIERKCDKIEVVGRRIVVCGTLRGSNNGGLGAITGGALNAAATTLVPKWSPAVEADYINAGGLVTSQPNGDSINYDLQRKLDKYREVYHHFGAPVGWDLGAGAWAVQMSDTGVISQQAPYQNKLRETLGWIPLREGKDYSTDPETDNTGGIDTDVKHLLAFIRDDVPEVLDSSGNYTPRYVQCDQHGMHVSHPFMDWGVVVDAMPAHLIAENHWTDAQWLTTSLEPQTGRYDHTTLCATIAIEGDQRIRLAQTLPASMQAGDGSVMTIVDEESELWILLPGTVIGVTTGESPGEQPGVMQNSGQNLRILRNDANRIALVLAGALSKYQATCARGQFVFKGFQPWGSLVGAIMTVYQQGDTIKQLGAVVTSVEWLLKESPETIVKIGYA